MFKKNGKDVEILRPLKHRPDVLVIVLNGTRKVMGDGSPFSSAELIELSGGLAESTTPKLKHTEDEQAQLDAAMSSLERARSCSDKFFGDLEDLATRLAAHYPSEFLYHYEAPPKLDESEIDRIKQEAQEVQSKLDAAQKIETHARIEFNELNAKIKYAARERKFPIE